MVTAGIATWLVLLVVFYFDPWPENGSLMVDVLMALGIVGTGVMLWRWRCPKCNKYLGGAYNPKFCPACGVRLVAL
jgi:hypothetical protein